MLRRTPSQQRRARGLLVLLAGHLFQLAAYITFIYFTNFEIREDPIPYHTSQLSGRAWVEELLEGHPDRIETELRVRKHVFRILVSELLYLGVKDERSVDVEEKLAIFLYTCSTALSIRHVGERFQRSNDTISTYFNEVLDVFSSPAFYNRYVSLPGVSDPVPDRIRNSSIFYPFFQDAMGAIDGTHITCWPSKAERELARDRKGNVSHNTLCSCSFDMKFQYAATGYDGSEADTTMFAQSRMQDLRIPRGKYLLADAGFPMCDGLLIPYSGVRYHLQEWARAELRPANREELFNLRHAQARNVIERIFGVIKARWRVLVYPLHYSMDVQVRVAAALMALHNLIIAYDPIEALMVEDGELEDIYDPAIRNPDVGSLAQSVEVPAEEGVRHKARRDQIAQDMWDSYQEYLRNRDMDVDM